MQILDAELVVADYYCNRCGARQIGIPVQESIYTGPPLCPEPCEEELSLDKIYLADD